VRKIRKEDIDILLGLITAFKQYDTWNKNKRQAWNEVLWKSENYEFMRFHGEYPTYGINTIGDTTIYMPSPQSNLYKVGIKEKSLIICVGYGGSKSRAYYGFPIAS
jgi:hypothetical protein